MEHLFIKLCTGFHTYSIFLFLKSDLSFEGIFLFLIFFIPGLIYILLGLDSFITNKFLPPLEYKISITNISILAPYSGYMAINYFFIGLAFIFPLLIPCLLLLTLLKVLLVWIYLLIAQKGMAQKELDKLKKRAKDKENNDRIY